MLLITGVGGNHVNLIGLITKFAVRLKHACHQLAPGIFMHSQVLLLLQLNRHPWSPFCELHYICTRLVVALAADTFVSVCVIASFALSSFSKVVSATKVESQ